MSDSPRAPDVVESPGAILDVEVTPCKTSGCPQARSDRWSRPQACHSKRRRRRPARCENFHIVGSGRPLLASRSRFDWIDARFSKELEVPSLSPSISPCRFSSDAAADTRTYKTDRGANTPRKVGGSIFKADLCATDERSTRSGVHDFLESHLLRNCQRQKYGRKTLGAVRSLPTPSRRQRRFSMVKI